MKITLIALAIFGLSAFVFSYVRHKAGYSSSSQDITYGPFTIRVTVSHGKQFNMNTGMSKTTDIAYAVYYAGKPVTLRGLENNTGRPYLWAVYILDGAPTPTLIAGSQTLFMIYEKDGQVVTEELVRQSSDIASLQLLDSEKGQPGKFTEVFGPFDYSDLSKLDTIKGGNLLMVCERGVLDISSRKRWFFNQKNEFIDNYSFPAPHGALALSPDGKNIVFKAEFNSWNTSNDQLPDSEYGLAVYDYTRDTGYVVKFDDTETRMLDIFAADWDWLNTSFEWKKEASGDYRLQQRKLDQLPPWKGQYKDRDNYYYLYPVKASMMPAFLDFVLAQQHWTKANIIKDETGEYTGHRITIGEGNVKLDIGYQEDDRRISFSKHLYDDESPEYARLVKQIADAFDAELAKGKYQEHFGQAINRTKQIMGN